MATQSWKSVNMVFLADFSDLRSVQRDKDNFVILMIIGRLIIVHKFVPLFSELHAVGASLHKKVHDKMRIRIVSNQFLESVLIVNLDSLEIIPPLVVCVNILNYQCAEDHCQSHHCYNFKILINICC